MQHGCRKCSSTGGKRNCEQRLLYSFPCVNLSDITNDISFSFTRSNKERLETYFLPRVYLSDWYRRHKQIEWVKQPSLNTWVDCLIIKVNDIRGFLAFLAFCSWVGDLGKMNDRKCNRRIMRKAVDAFCRQQMHHHRQLFSMLTLVQVVQWKNGKENWKWGG